MAGVVEDLVDWPDLDDPPGIHRGHAIGQLGGDGQVVGNKDHGEAELLLQPAQHLDYGALGKHIERGGRLIEDQDLRVEQQAHRDQHALAHPAAQFVRVGVDDSRWLQLHHAEQLQRAAACGSFRHPAVGLDRIPHLIPDPQHRVEGVLRALEHHRTFGPTEAPQLLRAQIDNIDRRIAAPVEDLALANRGLFGQQPHQAQPEGGFTAAALAHQRDALAAVELKTHPVDRLHQPTAGTVFHSEVLYRENDRRRRHRFRSAVGWLSRTRLHGVPLTSADVD